MPVPQPISSTREPGIQCSNRAGSIDQLGRIARAFPVVCLRHSIEHLTGMLSSALCSHLASIGAAGAPGAELSFRAWPRRHLAECLACLRRTAYGRDVGHDDHKEGLRVRTRNHLYRGAPGDAPKEQSSTTRKGIQSLREISGNRGAFLLVDRSAGKGIGVTLWESEEAMLAAGSARTSSGNKGSGINRRVGRRVRGRRLGGRLTDVFVRVGPVRQRRLCRVRRVSSAQARKHAAPSEVFQLAEPFDRSIAPARRNHVAGHSGDSEEDAAEQVDCRLPPSHAAAQGQPSTFYVPRRGRPSRLRPRKQIDPRQSGRQTSSLVLGRSSRRCASLGTSWR